MFTLAACGAAPVRPPAGEEILANVDTEHKPKIVISRAPSNTSNRYSPMDRKTKMLLALIAGGLWANAAAQLIRPTVAYAQQEAASERILRSIETHLSHIAASSLTIDLGIAAIRRDVGVIEGGLCVNQKICR